MSPGSIIRGTCGILNPELLSETRETVGPDPDEHTEVTKERKLVASGRNPRPGGAVACVKVTFQLGAT